MAYKHLIILAVGLLLGSCAQVGTISGGERDETAPQPIADKVLPPNASINFSGNRVEITFDEYFKLNNPNQNIRMVPPHATINASVSKKRLTLSWVDTLESNTTYAIYLNNAIKDITEGNDTTIQYVFSTGPEIDTLSYTIAVADAWTGEPIENCVVALYNANNEKLVSFAKTNNGIASLNHLHSGSYRMLAFNDANNDLEYQPNERLAFSKSETIEIHESSFDSVPLRMYTPLREPRIRTLKTVAPCLFILGANRPLPKNQTEIFVDGTLLQPYTFEWLSEDSLLFYPEQLTNNNGEVVLRTPTFNDTARYSIRSNDREQAVTIQLVNSKGVKPSELPEFKVNGFIQNVDSTMIHILNLDDTTEITDFQVIKTPYSVKLDFDKLNVQNIRVSFDKTALFTSCGASEPYEMIVKLNSERSYGALNVNVSDYSGAIIVDLLGRNKLIERRVIENTGEIIEFLELDPGEYHFRVIRDQNENGQWDVGELISNLQPEVVDLYSKKTKVRANWTIDVTLTPNE